MTQIFSWAAAALGLALALGPAQAQVQTQTQTVASAPTSAVLQAPASSLSPLAPAAVAAVAAVAADAAAVPPAAATAATATAAPARRVASAPRPAYRTGRTRGKTVQAAPIKICSVRVNAKKGEDRTASLSACIKE